MPFGLTIEEIRRGVSKLRNRVVGRVLHELGLIEQRGSGVRRMTEACNDMGLPPPTFEEPGTCFRVTLYGDARQRGHTPEGTAGRILDLLADGAELSTAGIADALGITTRTARTHLIAGSGARNRTAAVRSANDDPSRSARAEPCLPGASSAEPTVLRNGSRASKVFA